MMCLLVSSGVAMCIAYAFSLSYHQQKSILLSAKIASNDLYIFATNTDCYSDGYAVIKSPAVARGDGRQRVARRGYAPVLRGCF
ncbi:hypothetical protein DF051_37025 [Burkholderia contaminans]|uniref:Uncharacterized protein n=1 Tax=Burkholderia contaminans TaxID=488447 RepID=A0A3N8PBS7_9BURK|nr:hypothetical protein DF051_37025 [Burkholderia contaminans]